MATTLISSTSAESELSRSRLTRPSTVSRRSLLQNFGTPVQFQCLWFWSLRLNKTYRPCRPLSPQEDKLSVGRLAVPAKRIDGELDLLLEVLQPRPAPKLIVEKDLLVFLKLYDPEQTQLRYVGTLFVKASLRPSDILPKLRTLAGFHADEEIELYEEIKFEPYVMCDAINIDDTFSSAQIQTGDIICYQKSPKPGNKYPYVEFFFQHVHDQKEVKHKIQALEEEVVALKCQARLNKEEANMECVQLKQERDNAVRQVDELHDQNRQIVLEFSTQDLEQATVKFSNVYKVGDTGYGSVYKGIIHKTLVTIKIFFSQSLFQREVSILGEGKHPNIVTVVGICSEACAIVYEWLSNGNLEDHIVRTNDSTSLSWHKREQIIGEICSSLLYLHSKKPSALIHGDLRPCNILVDANYRSKLCNFVMSNPFLQPGVHAPNLTAMLPYIDPEFLTTGELTPLSDVYSLGFIILRLLTGMPPLSIAKKVAAALESDSLHLLIDKTAGNWPYTQAKQLALLGLSCAEMTREKRPDLLTKVWIVVEPMITKPPAASWLFIKSAYGGSCTPAHFFCPILKEIMNDPQVASDGFTYEAEAIRRWFDEGNNRSPMTNLVLSNRDLIPNLALRSSIQEYLQQQREQ